LNLITCRRLKPNFDLVQKIHGDYGHFDFVLPYVRSINQYINGHFDSIAFNFKSIN
jgi:hypothetical protein